MRTFGHHPLISSLWLRKLGRLYLAGLVVAIGLLVGCKQSIETSGEVFTTSKGQVTRKAGAVIYLIPEGKMTRLNALAKAQWIRDRALPKAQWSFREEYRELESKALKARGNPNRVVQWWRSNNPNDTQSDDEITLLAAEKYPVNFQQYPEAVADFNRIHRQEELSFTTNWNASFEESAEIMEPSPDLSDKETKEFLQEFMVVVADSEGKFKVKLPEGYTFFAFCESSAWKWCFKFTVAGQKLVLSSENALY